MPSLLQWARQRSWSKQVIWVDYTILALIMISALVGLLRGLVQETFSLLGWIAAMWVTLRYHQAFAIYLSDVITLPGVRLAASMIGLFVATLVVSKIVGYLVATLIERSPLSFLNRVGGLAFGAARGVLLILILILIAQGIGLTSEPWWHESQLIPPLESWAQALGQFNPQGVLQMARWS